MPRKEDVRFDIEARDQTKQAFDGVDRRLKTVATSAARMGAAIATAGLAAGAALTALTKKALEHADAIGKQADRIGVSTDALQEYRHAAQLSGVATEQLDAGLLKFSQNIGRLRSGTGELAEFLRKNDQQLLRNLVTTRSTDEALDVLFGTLGSTASQFERNALAAAAFGDAGLKMTTLVRDGADGLDKMRAEAKSLGLVIDEQLIRNAEIAQDEIAKFGRIVSTQGSQAVLQFAADIAEAARQLQSLAKDAFFAVERIFGYGQGGLVQALHEAREEWLEVNQALMDMKETMAALHESNAPADQLEETARSIDYLSGSLEAATERLRAAEEAFYGTKRPRLSVDITNPGVGGVPVDPAGGDFRGAKPKGRPAVGLDPVNNREQLEAELVAVRRATDEFARLAAAYGESEAAGKRMADQISIENEVRAAGLEIGSVEGQQLAEALALRNSLSNATERRIAELEQERQFQEKLGDAITDTAEEAIRDLINGYGSLREVGLKVLSALILRTLDLGRAMSATSSAGGGGGLGGVLSGVFGGLLGIGGGSAGGSSASLSRAASAGAFTTFRPTGGGFGFANGGIADRASIFGEAGPEAAVPLPDGRTIPVTLKGGGAGGGPTYYIDARGSEAGVEAKIEAVLQRRVPGIVQASATLAEARVGQARRRNRLRV